VKHSLLYKGLNETTLDNGMRVLVEEVPHSRSVSVGLWASVGGRDDILSQLGIAHLIEHMLFKGTPTRSSSQISHEIDSIGGQINAGTGREYTFYYAQAPLNGIGQVLEIISDITQHPEFSIDELEREKCVVLEEIRARQDDPEQQAHDFFVAGLWQDQHPLNQCVLGRSDTVENISRDDLVNFHSRYYHPGTITLVVCGGVDIETVVKLASGLFEPAKANLSVPNRNAPYLKAGFRYHNKDTGQSHIYIGFPAPSAGSNDRFAAEVVNTILGGGTSSHLFTRVREQLGLAYSVSSSVLSYSDTGIWVTYAGIAPRNTKRTLDVILEELQTLQRGVCEDELNLARAKLRGNLILDLESNTNRMGRLGSAVVVGTEIISPDKLIQRIDAVNLDDVHRIIDCYLDSKEMNVSVVGPGDSTIIPDIETH
jgi:predicted Zn-dependent peptidase